MGITTKFGKDREPVEMRPTDRSMLFLSKKDSMVKTAKYNETMAKIREMKNKLVEEAVDAPAEEAVEVEAPKIVKSDNPIVKRKYVKKVKLDNVQEQPAE